MIPSFSQLALKTQRDPEERKLVTPLSNPSPYKLLFHVVVERVVVQVHDLARICSHLWDAYENLHL